MAWLLVLLAALIGVGSFLFHTLANRWSELADTLPIWTFVGAFALAAMRHIGGMPRRQVALAGVAVAAAVVAVAVLATGETSSASDPLNGSGQYAPALLAFAVIGVVAHGRRHASFPWILAAGAVFLASLAFRTLDRGICESFPLGTHFLWHLLNGLMVGLLLQMFLRVGLVRPAGAS